MNTTIIQEEEIGVEVKKVDSNALALAILDRIDYFLEYEWDDFIGTASLAIIIGGTILMLESLYQIDFNNDVVNNLQLAAAGALSIPFGVAMMGNIDTSEPK